MICVTFGGGCRALSTNWKNSHVCEDLKVGYRNWSSAEHAWKRCHKRFRRHAQHKHFKRGFLAGFNDVAEGGKGCAPTMAPQEYWGCKYQCVDGQAAIAAWFEGFSYGAAAAESANAGTWNQIPISPQIQGTPCPNCPKGNNPAGRPVPTIGPTPIPEDVLEDGVPAGELLPPGQITPDEIPSGEMDAGPAAGSNPEESEPAIHLPASHAAAAAEIELLDGRQSPRAVPKRSRVVHNRGLAQHQSDESAPEPHDASQATDSPQAATASVSDATAVRVSHTTAESAEPAAEVPATVWKNKQHPADWHNRSSD